MTVNRVLSHRVLTANGNKVSPATSGTFPPTFDAFRSSHLGHTPFPPPLNQSGDFLLSRPYHNQATYIAQI
ncbi:hypothetical protein TNCV_2279801 [Trichonephila clavipes]|uniref:Uncharacterized protein n=1 Tax=Trichonephila clavipes TaxID=2585209 RepID=A0A8X6RFE4_TRICX|nr:hypothetical protein TNCV_2279801 [Trichonephila clavipes]